jgi:predicted transport protein
MHLHKNTRNIIRNLSPKWYKNTNNKYKQIKRLCCYWHVHVKQCGARFSIKIDVNGITSVLSLSEQLFTHTRSRPIRVPHVVDGGGSTAYISLYMSVSYCIVIECMMIKSSIMTQTSVPSFCNLIAGQNAHVISYIMFYINKMLLNYNVSCIREHKRIIHLRTKLSLF